MSHISTGAAPSGRSWVSPWPQRPRPSLAWLQAHQGAFGRGEGHVISGFLGNSEVPFKGDIGLYRAYMAVLAVFWAFGSSRDACSFSKGYRDT